MMMGRCVKLTKLLISRLHDDGKMCQVDKSELLDEVEMCEVNKAFNI